MARQDNNISDTFNGTWSSTALTVVICSALASYNALECLVLVLSTFKRYVGLYFWSLVVANLGILPYMPGVIAWYFDLTPKWTSLFLIYTGWYAMVTGQSVVLYSRLGLVLGTEHERLHKTVKWMIITNALIFHGVTTVISCCSVYAPNPIPWARAYYYIEKLQMTAFSTQELIISTIYIWKTLQILRSGIHAHAQRIIIELLTINFIIVMIDIGLLALEYRNLFFHELGFKMVAYSVKAKLEFAILSKLVEISGSSIARSSPSVGRNSIALDPSDCNPIQNLRLVSSIPQQPLDTCKSQLIVTEGVNITTRDRYSRSAAVEFAGSNANRTVSEIDYADVVRALSKG